MRTYKIVVERHLDGFVAYPLGLRGIVVGEGDSAEDAVADVRSAIRFHLDTFGAEAVAEDSDVLEAFLTETELAV